MAIIKKQYQLVCASHEQAPCELPEAHEGYCLCKKCGSPMHVKRRLIGKVCLSPEREYSYENALDSYSYSMVWTSMPSVPQRWNSWPALKPKAWKMEKES